MSKNNVINRNYINEIIQNVKHPEIFNIIKEQVEKLKNLGFDIYKKKKKYEINLNIPKQIFFIWIGSNIPDKYINNLKTYINLLDDYKIYLYLDKNSNEIKIENINIKYYEDEDFEFNYLMNKLKNPGRIADVLRVQLIYKYGGIYSDIDSICLKKFDERFCKAFLNFNVNKYAVSNNFFGFPKNDLFLEFYLRMMEFNLPKIGPALMKKTFLAFDNEHFNYIDSDLIDGSTIKNIKQNMFRYEYFDGNWLKYDDC